MLNDGGTSLIATAPEEPFMSETGKRVLKRTIGVAIVLALMGYIFAEVFLVFSRMNGGVVDPANDSVRWRTPLTMALIGGVLQLIVEIISYALRNKKPVSAAVSSNPSSLPPQVNQTESGNP